MTTMGTKPSALETVDEAVNSKGVRYAVRWSDGALFLGHGLTSQESAERWFSWLRDSKFRHGIPSLVEVINDQWVEVPLGIGQVAKQA